MLRLTSIILAIVCSVSMAFAAGGIDDLFPPSSPTPTPPGKPEEGGPSKPKPTPPPAAPVFPGTCKNMALPSGKTLNYCVHSYQKDQIPQNVIYYFHGLNGKPSDLALFLDARSPFYSVIKTVQDRAPIYVALSFGPRESIPVEPTGDDPATLRDLVDVAMPAIENDYIFYGIRPARHLIGMSLGGYNALTVAALRPKVFTSVMAICPALIDFNPFEQAEVTNYISRGGPWIQTPLVTDMISAIRTKFKTVDVWNGRNPMSQMRAGKYRNVNLYLSTGDRDEYGFFEGAEAFAAAAQQAGSPLVYEPTNGGHCTADLRSFQSFLSNALK
ncbi:alpha/beta hydrolase-fold protein [Bdellovibrio sp. HCB337]|uniref:alpha/beta hydrolase-fold protein n=1 Tax=Bdellovibrio sp. HCB337 TaxID=3394358 RepID=UPI0039A5DC49